MFSLITNLLEPLSFLSYCLVFALCWRKNKGKAVVIPLFFYLFAGIAMSYCSFLAHRQIKNVFIYNYVLLPASLVFYSFYFYSIISGLKKRKVIQLLFFINIVVFIFKRFFIKQNEFFDSISFALLGITTVIFCLLFFSQKLAEVSEEPIFTDFNFWVVCSYFISSSGSFLVFLTYYYLTEKIVGNYNERDIHTLTVLWAIPNILLFAGSCITLTGFAWVQYHKRS